MGKKKRQNDPHENSDNSSTASSDENNLNNQGNSSNSSAICSHVRKSVDPGRIRKEVKRVGLQLEKCSECLKSVPCSSTVPEIDCDSETFNPTLWLCLKCGTQLCGRSKNQHALNHFTTPHSDEHSIAVNTTTFEIWCYKCNKEIKSDILKRLLECIEFLKKEQSRTMNALNDIENKNIISTVLENLRPLLEDTTISNDMKKTGTVQKTFLNTDSKKHLFSTPPRVRGLTNLGNTCFFNAVLQCLAQTPYLVPVLRETSISGEEFMIPGGNLKLNDGNDVLLPPIKGKLESGGGLTNTLADTLDELQLGGGVFKPNDLLYQLAAKWPQFAGGQQHDSHELLRHLLESVRSEDLRRYQAVILHELGYNKKTDPAKVEGEMKQKIKYYGFQANDHVLVRPDQVFRGFLVSTLTCQECYHTSSRHEYFLDISLPVSIEKPQPPIRRKSSPEPVPSLSKHQQKKEKEREKKSKRNGKFQKKKEGTGEDEATVNNEEGSKSNSSCEQSDADIEDNLIDDTPKPNVAKQQKNRIETNLVNEQIDSPTNPEKTDDAPENVNKDVTDESNVSNNVIVELTLSSDGCQTLKKLIQNTDNTSNDLVKLNSMPLNKKHKISNNISSNITLAPRYQCEDGECSIQSCLNNFTAAELLTGNNKVGCSNCTLQINGKDGKTINTNATKQFIISSPPAVLILHLKRFQVESRYMFRKLTKHVSFPFVLDIAPFCSANVKNLSNVKNNQKKLLYSLYGIVEHSGTIHGGHYVAYVKARSQISQDDPRWSFLPKFSKAELIKTHKPKVDNDNVDLNGVEDSDDSTSDSLSDSENQGAVGGSYDPVIVPPTGKWYHVSDSHVYETSEESVKNAQAYLLFYERIY